MDDPITPTASELEPDIAIVRLPQIQCCDRHSYPADIYWIIDDSDSGVSKDLEEKRQIYATAGIPEYWVVNLKAKHLRVLREPGRDPYRQDTIMTTGLISPLAFPEVKISVARILGILSAQPFINELHFHQLQPPRLVLYEPIMQALDADEGLLLGWC